ncbi:fdxN element excision recombinase XisF [Nostoc sp.]|uniref:fdxN element excision recombinase XisF n=1 Tax=Nostoc sp. TaxID=1180 RepID=UPI002FF7EAB0
MIDLKKAVGYFRASKKDQKNTLAAHLSRLLMYGLTESQIFWDVETGSKSDRDGYQEVLSQLRSGKTKWVVTTRLDRFTRSSLDWELAIRDFSDAGAEIICIDESSIDLNTPGGLFFSRILAARAQSEIEELSKRSREGWKYLRKKKIAVNPPFGYRLSQSRTLELNTDPFLTMPCGEELSRAEIAQDIIDTFFRIESLRGTVRAINHKYGVQNLRFNAPRAGFISKGRFHVSVSGLKYWLTNPVLCGHYRYLEGSVNEEIIYNTHPDHRLLTNAQQENIHLIIADNATRRGFAFLGAKYPFSGLVYCAECGATAYSNKAGARNGIQKKYYYYRCSNAGNLACNQQKMARMDILEKSVIEVLIERKKALASLAQTPQDSVDPPELASLRTRLFALEAISGFDPDIEEARTKLRNRIASYSETIKHHQEHQSANRKILLAVFSDPDYWLTLLDDEKRKFYRLLVKKVIIRDGQVEDVKLHI